MTKDKALTAEERAKREALAGYVLNFTHQDERPLAELRWVWDVAWAAAASYDAYQERVWQEKAAAEVPLHCPYCQRAGEVRHYEDQFSRCWRCGACGVVWEERTVGGK